VLSLAIGNLTAIVQSNFKRMLAYSTISHMGFVLLGLLSGVMDGSSEAAGMAYGASLFYMVIYVLTTLVTFGLIMLLSHRGFECEDISDLKGLNRRSPLMAAMLLLAMFSLTGIPPMAGFYAKLAVLQALIGAGYIWMAVFAVIMSLIGAFYYLRVVKVAYFDEPEGETGALDTGVLTNGLMTVNGALVLLLGILPGGLMALCVSVIRQSMQF
ncbi:MAG TPA: proton-conducting transporter membrane subunit, partial [Burkholderiaceae bacterium]|nr:proton-conducting transporter membrane subunit [Burkholderiaceae bacterium]